MHKKKTFGLGYHRLSRSTKWRRCDANKCSTWQDDSESSSSSDEHSSQNDRFSASGGIEDVTVSSSNVVLETTNATVPSNLSSDNESSYSVPEYNSLEGPCSSPDDLSSCTTGSTESDKDFQIEIPHSSSCLPVINSDSDHNSMIKFLQGWAVDFNIPHSAVDALLKGLKNHPSLVDLPSCARTILHTPSNLIKHVVEPGCYVHLGLRDQLITLLMSQVSVSVNKINLMVNVDGLPPFKSSQGELYPILVSILNIPKLKGKVIPVGLYYGNEKPRSITEFLMPFIGELVELINNGVRLGESQIQVSLAGFCCDAPAKSFVMGIIGHGGFYSCTKCTVQGVTIENKRVFLQTDCRKRSHDDFINKTDKHFCCRDTPLVLIPNIHFVDSFVLDYMHLVCLGVVRTLLFTWNSGTKSQKRSRISKTSRTVMSERLVSLASNIPCEFSRKTRNLSTLLRWKATEFRLFLLYVGPVVLKGILDSNRYMNFLELHAAMTILLNPVLCKNDDNREISRKLLVHFVKSVAVLYGEQLITHNFHGLIHLVDDADNFIHDIEGFSLNDISAFQFENFLQSLKRLIRGKNKPLEQISKRLAERFILESKSGVDDKPSPSYPYFLNRSIHNDGPLLALCCAPQYKTIVFENFKITTSSPDSCCMLLNGEIIKVYNFAFSTEKKEMVVIGKKFLNKIDFYSDPLVPSSHLGIYRVEKLSPWKFWPLTDIVSKCVCLPYKNGFVVFPLIHTSQ